MMTRMNGRGVRWPSRVKKLSRAWRQGQLLKEPRTREHCYPTMALGTLLPAHGAAHGMGCTWSAHEAAHGRTYAWATYGAHLGIKVVQHKRRQQDVRRTCPSLIQLCSGATQARHKEQPGRN